MTWYSFLALVTLVSGSGNTRFWFWYQLFLVLVSIVFDFGINCFRLWYKLLGIYIMYIFDTDTMCLFFRLADRLNFS